MKPQRPYLLRAIYEWIQDSGEVPYLLVDATADGVVVPQDYVQDNQIVLNVSDTAVRDLNLGDEFVMFSSRFNGIAMEVVLPVDSIKAIYCRDSGEGMAFTEETAATARGTQSEDAAHSQTVTEQTTQDDASEKPARPDSKQKPTLKLV